LVLAAAQVVFYGGDPVGWHVKQLPGYPIETGDLLKASASYPRRIP
jgi:hypothetical protein